MMCWSTRCDVGDAQFADASPSSLLSTRACSPEVTWLMHMSEVKKFFLCFGSGAGETPELDRDNSVAPFSLEPPARATLTSELGKTVSFVLQAFDDDDCVEISISDAVRPLQQPRTT